MAQLIFFFLLQIKASYLAPIGYSSNNLAYPSIFLRMISGHYLKEYNSWNTISLFLHKYLGSDIFNSNFIKKYEKELFLMMLNVENINDLEDKMKLSEFHGSKHELTPTPNLLNLIFEQAIKNEYRHDKEIVSPLFVDFFAEMVTVFDNPFSIKHPYSIIPLPQDDFEYFNFDEWQNINISDIFNFLITLEDSDVVVLNDLTKTSLPKLMKVLYSTLAAINQRRPYYTYNIDVKIISQLESTFHYYLENIDPRRRNATYAYFNGLKALDVMDLFVIFHYFDEVPEFGLYFIDHHISKIIKIRKTILSLIQKEVDITEMKQLFYKKRSSSKPCVNAINDIITP